VVLDVILAAASF